MLFRTCLLHFTIDKMAYIRCVSYDAAASAAAPTAIEVSKAEWKGLLDILYRSISEERY